MIKLLIVPLASLLLMVTVTSQGQQQQADAQDDEGCYLIPSDSIGDGWQRKVCENGQDSYISPSGEECFANSAEVDVTSCGNEVSNPNRMQVD